MKKLLLLTCLIISGFMMASAQAPSIGTLVKAMQQATTTNPQPVIDMLNAAGYSYRFTNEEPDYGYGPTTIYVLSKNCKVVHEEYVNGLEYTPVPEVANASIIILKTTGNRINSMDVQIYSNSGFKT